MARRKKSSPFGGVEGVEVAAENALTRAAIKRRGRHLLLRMGLCALVVIGLNACLHRWLSGSAEVSTVVGIMSVVFLAFLGYVYAYLRYMHVAYILRRNPWVEWLVRVVPMTAGGFDVGRVAIMAHPEWNEEEVRTMHPRSWARVLTTDRPVTMWVAGNPRRTLVASGVGGAKPLHCVRWPALARRLLRYLSQDRTS